MMAGSILTKDQRLCGICVYWHGSRETYPCGGMVVDLNIIGHCECPDNAPHDQQWGIDSACPKYVVHPAIS